jgi:hypothetical protein
MALPGIGAEGWGFYLPFGGNFGKKEIGEFLNMKIDHQLRSHGRLWMISTCSEWPSGPDQRMLIAVCSA